MRIAQGSTVSDRLLPVTNGPNPMNEILTYSSVRPVKPELKVVLHGLPAVQPQLIKTTGLGLISKVKALALPRKYILKDNWRVEIIGFETVEQVQMDMDICIPANTEIDGASIPAPWLIALLSFGVLRPMGILFTASIVHDYAFQTGSLPYTAPRKNYFKRHNADKLFKDMTSVVNETPVAAFFAWWGVRLGSLGFHKPVVDYVSNWNTPKGRGPTPYQLKKRAVLDRGKFPEALTLLTLSVLLAGLYGITKLLF